MKAGAQLAWTISAGIFIAAHRSASFDNIGSTAPAVERERVSDHDRSFDHPRTKLKNNGEGVETAETGFRAHQLPRKASTTVSDGSKCALLKMVRCRAQPRGLFRAAEVTTIKARACRRPRKRTARAHGTARRVRRQPGSGPAAVVRAF
jgi:hypothetical protein